MINFHWDPKDLTYYNLACNFNIISALDEFTLFHYSKIKEGFNETCRQMPQNAVKQMNFQQFFTVLQFAFAVSFAKSIVSISSDKESHVLILAAQMLAQKMCDEPEKEEHILMLNSVLEKCSTAILEAVNV